MDQRLTFNSTSTRTGRIKRYGFLVFLTPPLLPWLGIALSTQFGATTLFAFFTVFYVYALIPLLDLVIGKDPVNLDSQAFAQLSDDPFYRYLTYACAPLTAVSLWLGAYGLRELTSLSTTGQIGWIVSHGLITTSISINAAHELIHKRRRFEQRLGSVLLSLVCYPGFQIEHLRGHHVHVSTPNDQSSARYGQSIYHFLPRAIAYNLTAAWRLERERLERKSLPILSTHNALLRGYALSALFAFAFFAMFGGLGLTFFLGQSAVAIVTLETVNYLEHYGLRRRRNEQGKYERTNHTHSWNSNYLLTNMLLFQVQRHSDHHEFPARRYQVLRHIDDSPQLPAGYATMMVLAWITPLWRRVMDPRVEAYYRDEPELLHD
ncbi:MAG: alkane 1-monooxygenase [Gammaproteobacteria bacterium]